MEDKSKPIGKADDSAGAFLARTLNGDVGRNFDIDSMFYTEDADGTPHWVILEFLKCDTVPPDKSHPNRYWNKNKRKFLSLWAVVIALRDAGCRSDLVLINYSESVSTIKRMDVSNVEESKITTTDTVLTFEQWQQSFRSFNATKRGDTWDYLTKKRRNS